MPLPPDAHLPDDTGRIIADPARFCTGHTLAAGEPLAGTGAHQAHNILIQWPKGRWEHSLRIAAQMPDDLVAAIDAAVEAGWRVNLIDRKPDPGGCIIVFPQAFRCDLPLQDYPALIQAIAKGQDLSSFAPSPVKPSSIFVCTHGKHDACCAKWGFAAYKALCVAAPAHGDHFDIWEITHLGGCRHAGGALVLPAGRKYGRLVPADAAPLLAAEVRDLPYLPAFRGTNHLLAPAQVAEIIALSQLPSWTRCTAVDEHTSSADRIFTVHTSAGKLLVRCWEEKVQSYGACADLTAQKPIPSRSIWRGTLIEHDNKVDIS
ncbi:sucrase ferredoxin [Cognatiyoonia sp. IB215182]|uniref:sucrase ferredoxin n=1 Tax=Cognatiyoonia sp. IB215182 TaxID=3097353 RepID=UPI002A134AAE|nr:sucrase ferredoxin [Cognatiyoonia sp. IB215182]MDX8354782.1 sucrase ferredoxin [Cognatiyoonia sp. IB215182]